jgi:hypothetical protein
MKFIYNSNYKIKVIKILLSNNMPHPNVIHEVVIDWMGRSDYDRRRNFNCTQMITVVLNKSQLNKEYYYIMYKWIYDVNTPEEHPFCCDPIVSSETSGQECLWRNKESDTLVKYLVMPDSTLAKYSGSRSASCFRRDIIRAIAELGNNYATRTGNVIDNYNKLSSLAHMNVLRVYPGDGHDNCSIEGDGWILVNSSRKK